MGGGVLIQFPVRGFHILACMKSCQLLGRAGPGHSESFSHSFLLEFDKDGFGVPRVPISSAYSKLILDVGKGYPLSCSFATGQVTHVSDCWGWGELCDTAEVVWLRYVF